MRTLHCGCTALCYFLILVINPINAQIVLPHSIISRWSDESLMIRWEPATLEEWNAAIKVGYTVEIFNKAGIKVYSEKIMSKSYNEFQVEVANEQEDKIAFYEASANLLYPDQQGPNSELGEILQNLVETNEHTKDSFRLSLLSYYSSYDIKLARAIGLGIRITGIKIEPLICHLYVDGFEKRTHEISDKIKPTPQLPAPIAKWGNFKVRLELETRGKYKDYMGYFIERSMDGQKFFRLNTLPILDPAVGLEGDKKSALIGIDDSLAVNYKNHFYRVKAMDYFGIVTQASPVVTGYGYELIHTSPLIVLAEQDNQYQAHLVWEINHLDIPLINHFTILRSDSIDGKYHLVQDLVEKEKRELYLTMKDESNFFRIEIIPKDGKPVSSFPVFVMGMDTTPPLVPIVIGANIDSTGKVTISWNANNETDLWGYKIFMANFGTDEYSLKNATPILDTVFIDSVSLNLGTKNVYYVLQAVDKRNNRSGFTDPIIVAKPDILPPGAPIILQLVQFSDTVSIRWGRSGSSDAVMHQLFRRNLDDKIGWNIIAQFDTLNLDSIYLDLNLTYGHQYAYTMRAIDEVGLNSAMASMQVILLKELKTNFIPHVEISTKFNKESKEMKLSWVNQTSEELTSVLVYRGWDKDKLGKYKFVNSPEMSLTDSLEGHTKVYYRLKPTFKNQEQTYYSEVIEYIIED